MNDILILPGIGGSGDDHWQTYWQTMSPNMRRFQPASWNHPDLADWIEALDRAIDLSPSPPILVAHSLSTLLVPLWQRTSRRSVRGAFLVAVPDPTAAAYPAEALGFADVPEDRLRFPSVIMASSNDAYGSIAYARTRADQWGSEFIVLGPLGHINGAGGAADWPEGRRYFDQFAGRL